MSEIFFCLRDQHNLWLVALAALLSLISALSAVILLRQAQRSAGMRRVQWLVTTGVAAGFGIWATHFVAMMGYTPGMAMGYRLDLTMLSLLSAIGLISLGSCCAVCCPGWMRLLLGSMLIGGGIVVMHYTGMAAVELPAIMRWHSGFLASSVVLGIVPVGPALHLALNRKGRWHAAASALLLVIAVVSLHFTGMAAFSLVPSRTGLGDGVILSHAGMTAWVGAGALCLLLICSAAVVLSQRARAAIRTHEQSFSILAKGISDCALYMLTPQGYVASWNAGAQRLKGYLEEEATGLSLARFYTEADQAAGKPQAALTHAAQTGKFTGEGWRVRRDGSMFWAHVTIEKMSDEEGAHIGFAKITRDMTRLKEDQDRLATLTHHLDTALGNMHQGLCLFDADSRLVLHNPRFCELWGVAADACPPGTHVLEVARAAITARTGTHAEEQRLSNMMVLLEQSLANPDGHPVISEYGEQFVVSIASRALPGGGWVSTFEDITERRKSEARIAHMALHDGLTGLPNRVRFNEWTDMELAVAKDHGLRLAMVAIDLDRFKEINDSRGHAAGDLALKALTARFNAALSDLELIARLGGDEFAAAKVYRHEQEVTDFVARLASCFDDVVEAGEEHFLLSASLGVALYPEDGQSREQLLNNADLAMYRAKSSMTAQICYYEENMDQQARHRRQIANDLREAIDRDEFELFYQRQHCLRTGEISGYEALLRWHHPTRGMVSPLDFIPIAEETGAIFRIGEWVLRQACEEAVLWEQDHKIAVNLSPVQLLQPDLVQSITAILLETGLPPRRLELEITESAIITDKQRALHILRQIKGLGINIAIDDFGTGYSSLDTLHSFPFDKIKIDKSFLLQSDSSTQARAIVRAVLALGRSLEVPVLAEGVESAQHVELLRQEGCQEAQGYFYARPAPAPSLQGKGGRHRTAG